MIVVKMYGGLGNQFFQYAAGLNLAHRHRTELYVDLSWHKKYGKKLDRPFLLHNFFDIKEAGYRRHLKYLRHVREKQFHFDYDVYNSPNNSYLEGYFQSSRYFSQVEMQIRNSLTPDITVGFSAKSIAVHFRRDHYPEKNIHRTLPESYYEKAIGVFRKMFDGPVVVFSDNQRYAEECEVFQGMEVKVSSIRDPVLAFRAMLNFGAMVIANSTFSWWAAYVSQALTVAPKIWFGPGGRDKDTRDLYSEGWIRI